MSGTGYAFKSGEIPHPVERVSLDHVALAVRAAMQEGEPAIRRYFREEMTTRDALKFDGMLVRLEDHLARMSGSTEDRFVERCTRMLRNLQGAA